jgi:hypothetical protein
MPMLLSSVSLRDVFWKYFALKNTVAAVDGTFFDRQKLNI